MRSISSIIIIFLINIQKKMYIMQNQDIMKDWQEDIGDRMVKLVFIGQKMDKEHMIEELDKCLMEF